MTLVHITVLVNLKSGKPSLWLRSFFSPTHKDPDPEIKSVFYYTFSYSSGLADCSNNLTILV